MTVVDRNYGATMLTKEPVAPRVFFDLPEIVGGDPPKKETKGDWWEVPYAKDADHLAYARRFAECVEAIATKCFWTAGWDIVVRPVAQKDAIRGAGMNRSTMTRTILIRVGPKQNDDPGFLCTTAEIAAHEIAHILFADFIPSLYDVVSGFDKATSALSELISSHEEQMVWAVARSIVYAYPAIATEYGETP